MHTSGARFTEQRWPISLGREFELARLRWDLRSRDRVSEKTCGKIGYVPEAIVSHWVNPKKLSRMNLLQRAWQAGLTASRLHGTPREDRGFWTWSRHCLSGALRGRLVLTEQLYLLRWLGQLWGQRHEP